MAKRTLHMGEPTMPAGVGRRRRRSGRSLAVGEFALALLCACAQGGSSFDSDAGGGGVTEPDAGTDAVLPGNTLGNDAGDLLVVPDGGGSSVDGGPGVFTVTVRDFKMYNASDPSTNPDFENVVSDDKGIVEPELGADRKPVYRSDGGTTTTHGKAYFDQWYNDVPGMNIAVQVPLVLSTQDGGTLGYDSLVSGVPASSSDPTKMWFPIDDGTPYARAFGNQGLGHNYSFTTELHTLFTYRGGESFSFSGDDDVFVFIDNQLVIDLGGVHPREEQSVELDTLGLVKGQQYPLDLFNAERHTPGSNLSFTTTLVLQPVPR